MIASPRARTFSARETRWRYRIKEEPVSARRRNRHARRVRYPIGGNWCVARCGTGLRSCALANVIVSCFVDADVGVASSGYFFVLGQISRQGWSLTVSLNSLMFFADRLEVAQQSISNFGRFRKFCSVTSMLSFFVRLVADLFDVRERIVERAVRRA